jgi:hypothetical protein
MTDGFAYPTGPQGLRRHRHRAAHSILRTIAVISSTNNGLPSAASTMRRRTSASSAPPGTRFSIRAALSSGDSGSSRSEVAFSFPPPHAGRNRLHVDCVTDEPERRRPDEDLAGRRDLLEPGGNVHRITRDESPALARDDFTGVYADPDLQLERFHRALHLGGHAHRAQRIVLMRPAEHRIPP